MSLIINSVFKLEPFNGGNFMLYVYKITIPHVERPFEYCDGRVDFVSGHGAEGARSDRAHTKLMRLTM